MKFNERRVGKFTMPVGPFLLDTITSRKIMECCTILRAEYMAAMDEFEYIAHSPQFEIVKPHSIIPEYVWLLATHEPLGQLSATAVRRDAV